MRINLRLFVIVILCIFALSSYTLSAKEKFVVVIDAGHGGGDVGTPHRHGKQDEKTIALNVALRLGRMIEWNYKDVRVVYTRNSDVYPSLPDRVKAAKNAKGDLFISIHVNACPDAAVRGFETYVFGVDNTDSGKKRLEERMVEERENLDISGRKVNFDTDIDIETRILCQAQREKHNKQSNEVARSVQNALIRQLKKTSYASNVKNRGIKAKNLFVLCFAPMPAILVELGYMSNRAEEKFLNTEEAQSAFASALYDGFKDYKQKWDKRQLNGNDSASTPAESTAPARPVAPATPDSPAKPAKQATPAQPATPAKPATTTPQQSATTPAQPAKPADDRIIWKIQFLTSDKLLSANSPEFKGLKNVTHYKDGKIYKYTYGSAASTKDLSTDMKKVKALFPTAFYVKFNSKGERIK